MEALTLTISTRLWDFSRPEPLPDGPRGALPWPAVPFAKLAADLGCDGVHLDARIPDHRFEEVIAAIRAHGLALASIDGLSPQPAELARHEPAADLVPLANPDESERRVAIRLHRRTIERASEISVPLVVLTAGRIPLPADLADPAGERETRATLARRSLEAPRYVDALRFALDELLPVAEGLGRTLAIVADGRLAGVPSFQELRSLLDELRGAPLGCVLDVAGVWALERRGIRRVETWSELRGSTLALRVADSRDGREAVPGEGEIDLAALTKSLAPEPRTHRLVDLGADHDLGRVRDGVALVRKGMT